eukprot:TRINITY_DN21213_c0_g3_i1.p1 TRINITY_DN21213_c0_g3~~TRINITY_DN21213_c0_g3_i1.p1  ORF type:complete len:236 (+),score=43.09 TRINITY_DN21213_c0_g3_i1:399-1106(+)
MNRGDIDDMRKVWNTNIPLEGRSGALLLAAESLEYQFVEQIFYLTMPRSGKTSSLFSYGDKQTNSVVRIEKILRPVLRQKWEAELQKTKARNNNLLVEYVKILFYAPHIDPVQMCATDEPWPALNSLETYSGTLPFPLGNGLHFMEDAATASKYGWKNHGNWGSSPGNKYLILAEVIVGDEIQYESGKKLSHPPLKENGDTYDSVVCWKEGEWYWAIFDSLKAYPTYLIEYSPNK